MYVCVCNAVTEDDVRGCVLAGACSTREVRSACGMQPGCGSCTKRIRALVSESLTAVELVDAITGGPRRPVEAVPAPQPAAAGSGAPADPLVTGSTGDTGPVEHAA
jgi:bacterioferritin-associated ferredoxin